MKKNVHMPLVSRREIMCGSIAVFGMGLSTDKSAFAAPSSWPLPQKTTPNAPITNDSAAQPRILTLVAEAYTARLSAAKDAPEVNLFRFREIVQEAVPHDNKTGVEQPIIRAKLGENIAIRLENRLPFAFSLHIRGLRGENKADGVAGLTGIAVQPGDALMIPLYTRQAGSFLLTALHPHPLPEANARLLSIILVIEEEYPPQVEHDIPLSLTDWRMDASGNMQENFSNLADKARAGRLGNRLLINAAPSPLSMEVRPGARVRVRLVNAANARIFPLSVTNMQAQVIAIDSTPCEPFDPLRRSVTLSPSTRVEMILDMPEKPGESAMIEAKLGEPGKAGLPLFIFHTKGERIAQRGGISPLPAPDLPEEIKLQSAARAEMVITGGLAAGENADEAALARRFPDATKIFRINNGVNAGYEGKPLARLKRGQAFVLTIANKTAFPQVIGVHGHAFRLLHALDDGWDPYFLDTLFIAPNATQRIAMVAQNPGKWAIRATIAEHYASGVATWFEVG